MDPEYRACAEEVMDDERVKRLLTKWDIGAAITAEEWETLYQAGMITLTSRALKVLGIDKAEG